MHRGICWRRVDLATVEALQPGAEAWAPRLPLSSGGVSGHGAAALGDGQVLIMGGVRQGQLTARVERLDPASGTCTPLPPLLSPRWCFASGVLADGRVAVAGATAGGQILSSAEVYDPAAGARVALPPMDTPRGFAPGVVMDDGRFAVIGGQSGEEDLASG